MAKIKAPNSDYNGLSAGVIFKNGEGETGDLHLIRWFREHGYVVEDEVAPIKTASPASTTVWQDDAPLMEIPEEKPKPKRQTRKRGGKQ